jgi:DNA-binding NtrC family response regulator
MNQPFAINGIPLNFPARQSGENLHPVLAQPTVVVATTAPAITENMRDLLQIYSFRTVWAKSVSEVQATLTQKSVVACFCGFWLIDGTYRDVVRLLRSQPVEVPAIILCEPACPQEYRDYLAALNIRAFDFICHPYRRTDLERILRATLSERALLTRFQSSLGNSNEGIESHSDLRKAG